MVGNAQQGNGGEMSEQAGEVEEAQQHEVDLAHRRAQALASLLIRQHPVVARCLLSVLLDVQPAEVGCGCPICLAIQTFHRAMAEQAGTGSPKGGVQ